MALGLQRADADFERVMGFFQGHRLAARDAETCGREVEAGLAVGRREISRQAGIPPHIPVSKPLFSFLWCKFMK